MTQAETSPDVCYRHPTRESWVLCQRCGRTICPECQILTPSGVQCPECVKEVGGSVSWRSAGESRRTPSKGLSKSRARSARGSSGWQARLGDLLRPGSEAPVLSWGTIAIVAVLWIANLVTSGIPQQFLALFDPATVWQVWRFFTAALIYPAGLVFGLLLNAVFFLLIAPSVERQLGRARTLTVMLASAALGSSSMVLGGGGPYGLSGVLFGMFGATLVLIWSHPPARTQALIFTGINLLIVLFLSPSYLPQIIGGLIAGAGAIYLFQRDEGRPTSRIGRSNLIIWAVVGVFIAAALVRTFVL